MLAAGPFAALLNCMVSRHTYAEAGMYEAFVHPIHSLQSESDVTAHLGLRARDSQMLDDLCAASAGQLGPVQSSECVCTEHVMS